MQISLGHGSPVDNSTHSLV